jgi:DNA modification methylase
MNLLRGDCLILMGGISESSVDLVLSDPSYEFISKNPVGGGFTDRENRVHLERINDNFGMSY